MIIKATVTWTLSVTLDVPENESKSNVRSRILAQAMAETRLIEPTISDCVERPDVND